MKPSRVRASRKKKTATKATDMETGEAPPTVEEGGACDVDERNGVTEHAWEKVIHAPRMARGPGWGSGSKGNW